MKYLIMLLASVAVISLVTVTWLLTRVSAWIVGHDPVWDQMDKEGASFEHAVAEAFLVARNLYIPAIEAIIGIVFLVLLWRALPTQPKTEDKIERAAYPTVKS
jgi:hypothetical protein